MIHPDFDIQVINSHIGYGLISKRFLPAGTILFTHDSLDKVLSLNDPVLNEPNIKNVVEKYGFVIDDSIIIGWDSIKFVNHSCEDFNTLVITDCSCACSISIKDIDMNQEWLEDYTQYECSNVTSKCYCSSKGCKGFISNQTDNLEKKQSWEKLLSNAVLLLDKNEQPLLELILGQKHSNPNCRVLAAFKK